MPLGEALKAAESVERLEKRVFEMVHTYPSSKGTEGENGSPSAALLRDETAQLMIDEMAPHFERARTVCEVLGGGGTKDGRRLAEEVAGILPDAQFWLSRRQFKSRR